jgi:acetyl esterase/lipase
MRVFSDFHRRSRVIWALSLVLLLGFALALALSPRPLTRAAGYTIQTVTYCAGFQMNIYTPNGTSQPVPVVEYVHGGGWIKGSRTSVSPQQSSVTMGHLLSHGFIVTSIDYQLITPQNPGFPADIEDVACSIRFLRANAAAYHIDPNHIGLLGDSAGGQLVSLAGLAGPTNGFGNGLYPGVAGTVEAVEDLFGPTTSAATRFGTSRANPITWVSHTPARDPAFLILQGAQDTIVLPAESQGLYNALKAAGQSATLQMVQNAGHEFKPTPTGATLNPSPSQIDALMLNFFLQRL